LPGILASGKIPPVIYQNAIFAFTSGNTFLIRQKHLVNFALKSFICILPGFFLSAARNLRTLFDENNGLLKIL
jgi:hypothetical protein